MTSKQYRALLDLLMCSDPWPVGTERGDDGQETVIGLVTEEAMRRGHRDWIEAYHDHTGDDPEPPR